MADTFLFRVGLLGLLIKKFRSVLITHPIYLTLTIVAGIVIINIISVIKTVNMNVITGIYRVRYFMNGHTLDELWQYPSFIVLSILQKSGIIILLLLLLVFTLTIFIIIISIYTILFIKFTWSNKIIRTNIL